MRSVSGLACLTASDKDRWTRFLPVNNKKVGDRIRNRLAGSIDSAPTRREEARSCGPEHRPAMPEPQAGMPQNRPPRRIVEQTVRSSNPAYRVYNSENPLHPLHASGVSPLNPLHFPLHSMVQHTRYINDDRDP